MAGPGPRVLAAGKQTKDERSRKRLKGEDCKILTEKGKGEREEGEGGRKREEKREKGEGGRERKGKREGGNQGGRERKGRETGRKIEGERGRREGEKYMRVSLNMVNAQGN